MNFSNFRRRMSAVATAGILAGTMAFGAGEAQATIYEWTVSQGVGDSFFNLGDTGILAGSFKFDDLGDMDPNNGNFFDVNFLLESTVLPSGGGIFADNSYGPGGVSFSNSLGFTVQAASGFDFLELTVLNSTPGFGFEFDDDNPLIEFGVTLHKCLIVECVNPIDFTPFEAEINLQFVGAVSAVPVPAALPLFGTGLAIMGFLGWRRKSKAAAA